MGVTSALVFANLGAAYGTAKSGVGIASMGDTWTRWNGWFQGGTSREKMEAKHLQCEAPQ